MVNWSMRFWMMNWDMRLDWMNRNMRTRRMNRNHRMNGFNRFTMMKWGVWRQSSMLGFAGSIVLIQTKTVGVRRSVRSMNTWVCNATFY